MQAGGESLLLGNYVELVDSEGISKQKELVLGTLLGVLQPKTEYMRSRASPPIQINI